MGRQSSNTNSPPVAIHLARNRGVFLLCVLVALVTASVYFPSLHNRFINWDDDAYITDNHDIREISPDNLKRIFSSSYGYYHPLPSLTFMVEYAFFGLDPQYYHITNMLLHCCNAILVFFLVSVLSGRPMVGFVAALFFAVHPLRVESVAWVTERKGLLAALFFLLSLLTYIGYVRKGGAPRYGRTMLFFVLSLLSKPLAVSEPIVLLCIDWFLGRTIDKKALLEKLPVLAVAAGWVLVSFYTQVNVDALGNKPPFFVRLCLPFFGALFNVFATVLPIKLSALYPMPLHPDSAMKVWLFLSIPFVIGIGSAVFLGRRHSRVLVFGAMFSLFTLLPVLQIVPVGSFAVADRYTYLPAIGIAFVFAQGTAFVYRKIASPSRLKKGLVLLGLTALLLTYGSLTALRCTVWKDSMTLWNDALRHYPSAIAYNNRGTAWAEKGRADKAIDDFTSAIGCDRAFAKPYNNRGIAYTTQGMPDRAMADFSSAVKLAPDFYDAYNNRGVIHMYNDEVDKAIEDFSRSLELNPGYQSAYVNRGVAYRKKGLLKPALRDLEKAISLDPDDVTAKEGREEVLVQIRRQE